MKILVTGGSGFLGSNVADALQDAGHEVAIFDHVPSPYLRPGQTMIVGNMLDAEAVAEAAQGCGAIYHFAAIADLGKAAANPRRTVEVNIIGTLNALEAARQQTDTRLIFSSSIYVYSNQGGFYRTTKQACENLIHDYGKTYGLPFTILRFGSLYGPRADPDNAVRRIITQALQEGRIDFWGNGTEVREYIHVLDAAAMSVDILDQAYANQIIHLTGRERLTTREMLEMVNEILGGRVEIRYNDTPFNGRYVQTPYTFTPRLGRKMTRSTYIDLGLGLLDSIQQAHGDATPE